ncbi:UMF1 family MFS transporter [Mycetocola sp. BIGb0189]|uniref:MFS transporter n=1 Tax=Mycetocola sp. BIGb0189 TaxID=2940604 RepID=UPI002168C440|nr:MFS transporter [Mycetocola sp. BIGb0189]MCS4277211.1 UMF1 family MFS transporter [Mycetocola sp. BIGb0189]
MTSALRTPSPEPRLLSKPVLAWGMWDWGSAAFNAVVTTFVFTTYLTRTPAFGGEAHVSAQLSWWISGAGVIIALLAPVTGQRADRSGRRKFWLGVNTYLVVAATAGLAFVAPEPDLLWLGLFLLAAGNIFFEFASVNYNAMLGQISTPATIGKISGFGWGLGYIAGIVLLLILYVSLIGPDVGIFGITSDNGWDVRISMLIAAAWLGLSAIPVLRVIPEAPGTAAPGAKIGILGSYKKLGRDLVGLWRDDRTTARFLIASAIFRDGLAGVFTFAGVLAVGTFGFSGGDVILFGIAANVVAGVVTIASGRLDDRFGPRTVIMAALIGLVTFGVVVFVLHDGGHTVFWIFGLGLAAFVGPAQSASRSFLARIIPPGKEGELFGLYATTGRAVSFIAPAAFGIAVTLGGAQYFGILGLILVIALGLALMIPVRLPQSVR